MRVWRTVMAVLVAAFATIAVTAFVAPPRPSLARGGRGGRGGPGGPPPKAPPRGPRGLGTGGVGGARGAGGDEGRKTPPRPSAHGRDMADYIEAVQRQTATMDVPEFVLGARFDASAELAEDDRDAGLAAERNRASWSLRRAAEVSAHPL